MGMNYTLFPSKTPKMYLQNCEISDKGWKSGFVVGGGVGVAGRCGSVEDAAGALVRQRLVRER